MPVPPTRLALAAVTAVLTTTVLTGCGDSSSSSAATAPMSSMSSMTSMPSTDSAGDSSAGSTTGITIKSFAFNGPGSVEPGATVTVTNDDSEAHTVTADGAGGFDVNVAPGTTKTFLAPSEAGSYPYHCTFHSNMHGTLEVK